MKSKKYYCNQCNKNHYSSGKIFYKHLKSSNSPRNKPKCKVCGKSKEIAAEKMCYDCYGDRFIKRGHMKQPKKIIQYVIHVQNQARNGT